jgi:hypothetical protein
VGTLTSHTAQAPKQATWKPDTALKLGFGTDLNIKLQELGVVDMLVHISRSRLMLRSFRPSQQFNPNEHGVEVAEGNWIL